MYSQITQRYRKQILAAVDKSINTFSKKYYDASDWSEDICQRLKTFIHNGKLGRGSIFLFTYEMFGGTLNASSYTIAAILELFHASFLIHDDIMDNDTKRRGKDAIFYQYQQLFKEKKIVDAEHAGRSVGIGIGDIGFFLAYDILFSVSLSSQIVYQLAQLLSTEFLFVGLGQIQDIINSQKNEISEEEIIKVYKYKTAGYTFSLPFMLAGMMTKKQKKELTLLKKIGEWLGIIFQLKDDQLGLFGTEEKIGKPIGSDIRENKKTLYYLYIFTLSSEDDIKKALHIFGNKHISTDDILYIQSLIKKHKIEEIISQQIDQYATNIFSSIKKLSIQQEYKNQLKEFVQYNIDRSV